MSSSLYILACLLGVSMAQNGVCPTSTLQGCELKFFLDMGFPSGNPPVLDGAQNLVWAIDNVLNNQVNNGQTLICKNYQNFLNCLGTNEQNCLTATAFQGLGNNAGNATLYNAVYMQLRNRCYGNCQTAYSGSIGCVLGVNYTKAADINACYTSFTNSLTQAIQNNPNNFQAAYCSAVGTYVNCVGSVYTTNCANGEIGSCQCQQLQPMVPIDFPGVANCNQAQYACQ